MLKLQRGLGRRRVTCQGLAGDTETLTLGLDDPGTETMATGNTEYRTETTDHVD